MRARGPVSLAVLIVSPLLCALQGRAAAEGDAALVHPIYAQLPDLVENEGTRKAFAAAATRYKLQPLEVIDIPAPPAFKTPATLRVTMAKVVKLSFDEALPELDAAAAEVAETGGAGLSTAELSDVFLYRGWATARATWNSNAAAETAEANPARAKAFDEYLRAAALTPDRAVNARELPPQVVADLARAAAEVRKRPRGTLIVTGDADAQLSLDGAPATAVAGGVTFRDLTAGEHLLAVEELGRARWGTHVTIAGATVEQVIPPRPALGLDDAVAAAHARRMGARFALVGERKPGPGARLEMRLVDLAGQKRDGALFSTSGDERGTIDAAVMRLDEQARRLVQAELANGTVVPQPPVSGPEPGQPAPILLAPPPHKATLQEDPAAWARDRWPLLTAVGVMVGAAFVLTIAAAN